MGADGCQQRAFLAVLLPTRPEHREAGLPPRKSPLDVVTPRLLGIAERKAPSVINGHHVAGRATDPGALRARKALRLGCRGRLCPKCDVACLGVDGDCSASGIEPRGRAAGLRLWPPLLIFPVPIAILQIPQRARINGKPGRWPRHHEHNSERETPPEHVFLPSHRACRASCVRQAGSAGAPLLRRRLQFRVPQRTQLRHHGGGAGDGVGEEEVPHHRRVGRCIGCGTIGDA